ncbi:hypothetical protein [Undibacterium sp.]|uniref:hypothetical protein n=1 Tax=Undibacterium sp. TaxID=1914977 RepID=UPI0025F09B0B|nr:hypothetical protein [Undibacterium sp.]
MASNVSGKAYALTVLSPIKNAYTEDEIAYADLVRDRLQAWNDEDNSPMALVPNTYLCRYFVLDDVVNQSLPGGGALDTISDFLPLVPDSLRRSALPYEDHLQSRYLVFSCNFYCGPDGNPDPYLRAMWDTISARIKQVWGYCYGFEGVNSAQTFIAYIKRCSLPPALFFVGSNDDALDEQLKALYLKQEFSKFAVENQGLDAASLKIKLQAFMQRVAPKNLSAPSWSAGQYKL